MKRTLHFIVGGVMMLGAVLPALSQSFPDVPETHWAYEAINKLKEDGLLTGYPDGKYGGNRPLSRYEFAVAINAVYQKLKFQQERYTTRLDELKKQLDDVQAKVGAGTGGGTPEVTKADIEALNAQIDAVKADLAGMKSLADDVAALKKLSSTFEQDLASLGVDIEAMKKDIKSLDERLKVLEGHKMPVDIGGDVEFYARAGHSRDDHQGIDWNGSGVGTDNTDLGKGRAPVGINRDIHMMHEIGLTLSGKYGDNVAVNGEVVFGNLLGFEGRTLTQQWNNPFTAKNEGPSDVYVHHLEAAWDTSWLSLPMNIKLGRIGLQTANPYVIKRQDVDYYVDIPRWDNGNWYVDGGSMTFGSLLNLNIYGGKVQNRGSVNFGDIYAMGLGTVNATRPTLLALGELEINTLLGAELGFKLGGRGHLGVGYDLFDSLGTASISGLTGTPNDKYSRITMMDADFTYDITHALGLKAYYAKSDYFYAGHKKYDTHDWAFDGMLNFKAGMLDVNVGYREICPFFTAPGDWGRIGFINNPTDIKGFQGGLKYQFTNAFDAYATGEVYTGSDQKINDIPIGLTTDDKINRIQAGIGYKLTPNWHLGLGWEGVFQQVDRNHFKGTIPDDKVDINFYTAKLRYDLGKNTFWSFGYQLFDMQDKTGQNIYGVPLGSDNKGKSGLFFTQFSVKF